MATRKTSLNLPLPLQFLAAWLAVWLGRVLQEQVDYLKAENLLLRVKLGTKRLSLTDAEHCRLAMLRRQGRPKTAADIAALIVRMASENSWGYTRIKGALKNLGHKVTSW